MGGRPDRPTSPGAEANEAAGPSEADTAAAAGEETDAQSDMERQSVVARSVYLRFRQKYSGTLHTRPRARRRPDSEGVTTEGHQTDTDEWGSGTDAFGHDSQSSDRSSSAGRGSRREFGYLEEIARAIRGGYAAANQESDQPGTGRAGVGRWKPPHGIAKSRTGARSNWWDPKPVGTIIRLETKKRGWARPLRVSEVTVNWKEIVGPQVAEHCPVESFEGGTLIIRADSTAWAQQMQLLLPVVHKRIDEMVGAGVVDKVLVYPPKPPSWGRGPRRVPGRGPRDTYG